MERKFKIGDRVLIKIEYPENDFSNSINGKKGTIINNTLSVFFKIKLDDVYINKHNVKIEEVTLSEYSIELIPKIFNVKQWKENLK